MQKMYEVYEFLTQVHSPSNVPLKTTDYIRTRRAYKELRNLEFYIRLATESFACGCDLDFVNCYTFFVYFIANIT